MLAPCNDWKFWPRVDLFYELRALASGACMATAQNRGLSCSLPQTFSSQRGERSVTWRPTPLGGKIFKLCISMITVKRAFVNPGCSLSDGIVGWIIVKSI
jgi:hypothetical protein